MFEGKKATHIANQDARDGSYSAIYEYRTLAVLGVVNFDKLLNEHAEKGWELVNGAMAGTTHYGYLRRKLKASGAD